MRAIQYILTSLAGVAVGVLAQLAYQFASTWHHGGSADPRCVFGLRGYVEVRMLDKAPVQDQVFCRYRPDVWQTP